MEFVGHTAATARPVIVVADTGNDCVRIVFVRAKAKASTVHVMAVVHGQSSLWPTRGTTA